MRTYETIFIVRPDLVGDEYANLIEKFKGVLTDQGAEILKVEEWGTRKLAYPMKKQNRGTYVLFAFEAAPAVILEFERRMRIDEGIIKFQTVHLEKGLPVAPPVKTETEEAAGADEESAEEADETTDADSAE